MTGQDAAKRATQALNAAGLTHWSVNGRHNTAECAHCMAQPHVVSAIDAAVAEAVKSVETERAAWQASSELRELTIVDLRAKLTDAVAQAVQAEQARCVAVAEDQPMTAEDGEPIAWEGQWAADLMQDAIVAALRARPTEQCTYPPHIGIHVCERPTEEKDTVAKNLAKMGSSGCLITTPRPTEPAGETYTLRDAIAAQEGDDED